MKNLINKIHNCKNQDILPLLPDKSVQVFLEDMPYNGLTACHWDKKQDLKEYWELRLSKLKDNGCFVLFGSEPFSSYLRMSNIKMYKYDWIWKKSKATGHLDSKNKPLRNYENILIFIKKGWGSYNPQGLKNEIFKTGRNANMKNKVYSQYKNHGISLKGNYPKMIIKFSNPSGINNIHPTQKPVALFEYLIKTYSNENDLIFDGFSGSGTTAIACYNTNRNFICCELEKDYYIRSIKRIKQKEAELEKKFYIKEEDNLLFKNLNK